MPFTGMRMMAPLALKAATSAGSQSGSPIRLRMATITQAFSMTMTPLRRLPGINDAPNLGDQFVAALSLRVYADDAGDLGQYLAQG